MKDVNGKVPIHDEDQFVFDHDSELSNSILYGRYYKPAYSPHNFPSE